MSGAATATDQTRTGRPVQDGRDKTQGGQGRHGQNGSHGNCCSLRRTSSLLSPFFSWRPWRRRAETAPPCLRGEHGVRIYFGATTIIHDTPKRSATMPKAGEKNVRVIGICTCPPSASFENSRPASASS